MANANVKTVLVMNDTDKTLLAAMIVACEEEAKVRENTSVTLNKARGESWAVCRDNVLSVLSQKPAKAKGRRPGEIRETPGPEAHAKLLLDGLRTWSEEQKKAGREFCGMGRQYASDLSRAIRAKEKGIELPAELLKAGRTEWTESEFWANNGLLSAAGRKATTPAGRTATTEGGESVELEEGDLDILAAAKDEGLADLMRVVATLKGQFREGFLRDALEVANRYANRQHASTGTGQGAVTLPAAANG